MATPTQVSLPSEPYDNLSYAKELQILEQQVFYYEKIVNNPNQALSQEEFKVAEINIEKSRQAVTDKLAIIHEILERKNKFNQTVEKLSLFHSSGEYIGK